MISIEGKFIFAVSNEISPQDPISKLVLIKVYNNNNRIFDFNSCDIK